MSISINYHNVDTEKSILFCINSKKVPKSISHGHGNTKNNNDGLSQRQKILGDIDCITEYIADITENQVNIEKPPRTDSGVWTSDQSAVVVDTRTTSVIDRRDPIMQP